MRGSQWGNRRGRLQMTCGMCALAARPQGVSRLRRSAAQRARSLAHSAGESTLEGALQPLRGVKKAGNSSVWYAITATPCSPRSHRCT